MTRTDTHSIRNLVSCVPRAARYGSECGTAVSSGFFRVITYWTTAHVRRPITLLGTVIFSSGVLSAFLVNDAICLVMTPLVLELVTRLKRNPIPYLLAIATASNIGSVATITGNPQNIIIGSLSQGPAPLRCRVIPFARKRELTTS
ncbi:hypothetical protein IVA95_29895 [Bradyrhizobium sp. 157]|nr:hypothetical protein [Bradyrhizobium sp. 157]